MFEALAQLITEQAAENSQGGRSGQDWSKIGREKRAGDRIRTDDIHVGNVML